MPFTEAWTIKSASTPSGSALYIKEALPETIETPSQGHGVSTRFRCLTAEAGKDAAEALRNSNVMAAGEVETRTAPDRGV